MKKIIIITAILAFTNANAYHSQAADSMAKVLQAMFMAQEGQNANAAKQFAEAGEKLEDPRLLREAYRNVLLGNQNHQQALVYAQRWEALGGGAPAVLAQVHLLLVLHQHEQAMPLLLELKNTREYPDKDIYQLLLYGQDTLNLAEQLFGDDPSGRLYFAKIAIANQQWNDAEQALKRGVVLAPELYELRFAQMQLAELREKQPQNAIPLVDDFLKQNCPGLLNSSCQEDKVVYAYRLYAQNHDDWESAFDDESADNAALATGQFFEWNDMPKRAIPHYQKLRGRVFQADLGRARIARDAKQYDSALEILNNTPISTPREFVLREVTASDIIRDVYGAEKALDRIRAAYETNPDNPDLLYHFAIVSEESGDIDTSIILLERMTNLFPDSANGWNALGYLLADHDMRLQEAEQYVKNALEIEPGSPNIIDSLGWVYYRQGKLDKALEYLMMAVAMSNSAEIAAHLGEVFWKLGEHEKARAAFDVGRQHEPDNKVLNETVQRLQVEE